MLIIRILLLTSFTCLFLTACQLASKPVIEQGVVVAEKVEVRNSTGLVAASIKEVKRGQVLDILERRTANQQDYIQVRIPGENTMEGWMEARFIISKRIVDECNKLAQGWKDTSTQATGKTKDKLKLRLNPGRSSEVITLLPANTKLSIVGRARAERQGDEKPTNTANEGNKYDDWYKVRLEENPVIKAGWIYADSVEITPPDAISALPGAGRRFIAWEAFGEVTDPETSTTEKNYIILDKYAYSKEDEIDFDRIYVIAWDLASHGYKSILIESQIKGLYPLKVEKTPTSYLFNVSLLNKEKKTIVTRYQIKLEDEAANKWLATKIQEPKPTTSKPAKKKK
ncbi:MAG: hypothetical protein FD167_1182 [bacterium]|nr:MAG: hypothetical protein FD167_1182 [bacterium]